MRLPPTPLSPGLATREKPIEAPVVQCAAECLTLAWSLETRLPPRMLALLDGQPVATLTPQPTGVEMRVPVAGEKLPGFLNFRDAVTGAPLLAEPLRLGPIIAPRVERAVVVAGGTM